MPNPFGKTRPATQPYAIYRAGDIVYHVCKTYALAKNEGNHARWFVWAKSPMTYGEFEGGDTYANEVGRWGKLVAADPEWQAAYDTRKVPTVQDYLWQTASA